MLLFMLFLKLRVWKFTRVCKKLIVETNVGVAPGIAFGVSGEGHLRICFAAKENFIKK